MFGIDKAIEAISSASAMQAFFIALIVIAGCLARYYGRREQKAIRNVELPMFLLSGPVASVIEAIHDMAEESRKQTGLLQKLVNQMDYMDHQREVTQKLLEEIRNYQTLGSASPPRRKL